MATVPACRSLGPQCRGLGVTLRIADLPEDDAPTRDAIATWLLGHTQHVSFGTPRTVGRRLVVDATLHTPCRYLRDGAQGARCAAHGYTGSVPALQRPVPAPLVGPDGTITLTHQGRRQPVALVTPPQPRHALPTLQANPCATAPCRTADNTRGAACCRDLTLDVVLPADEVHAEALLAARKAPYVCKVERADADIVECEVLSACGYLDHDGRSCVLHDRRRPDGEPAKPYICSDWPDVDGTDTWHPGCVLMPVRRGPTAQPRE